MITSPIVQQLPNDQNTAGRGVESLSILKFPEIYHRQDMDFQTTSRNLQRRNYLGFQMIRRDV